MLPNLLLLPDRHRLVVNDDDDGARRSRHRSDVRVERRRDRSARGARVAAPDMPLVTVTNDSVLIGRSLPSMRSVTSSGLRSDTGSPTAFTTVKVDRPNLSGSVLALLSTEGPDPEHKGADGDGRQDRRHGLVADERPALRRCSHVHGCHSHHLKMGDQ
jgi:hypothetical protein